MEFANLPYDPVEVICDDCRPELPEGEPMTRLVSCHQFWWSHIDQCLVRRRTSSKDKIEGIDLISELILLRSQVTGRHLPAPELQYKGRKMVPQPDKGSCRDMRDTGFFQPGAITSLAIACFCSRRSAGGPIEDRASLQVNLNVPLRKCSL